MKYKKMVFLLTIVFFLNVSIFASKYIHHNIKAELFPDENRIMVTDTISLSDSFVKMIRFTLHGAMKVTFVSPNIMIKESNNEEKSTFSGINTVEFQISDKIPVKNYEITFNKTGDHSKFIIKYSGKIYHEIKQIGTEYARGFSETPGMISKEGVFLSGSSFWIPRFNDNLVTFQIDAITPHGWSCVSQGKLEKDFDRYGKHISVWNSPEPMDEVYLIAAKFFRYRIKQGKVNLYAYMRTDEKNLAMKYLNTTGQYLEMYNRLIGDFPYTKFALIENFWETGYGMPSFTLLGQKIIRFPFILHSSYPHELLHNWWGNSVFVDYERGNWCEGLTVFFADHLIKEQRNQGAEYRRTTLQGYTDYVNESNDFSVSKFRARNNASSSAIGYGKVMMIFNMLRNELGDEVFMDSIREFYKKNKFKKTDFSDIRESFEKISGRNLKVFFAQWVDRKGAPELIMKDAMVVKKKGLFELSFSLEQSQPGDPFKLRIPVSVYLKDEKDVKTVKVVMDKKDGNYKFIFKNEPIRIEVDPEFDIFRRLSDEEIPPSLSKIFGSKKVTIVISEKLEKSLVKNYYKLAKNWASKQKEIIKIVSDKDLTDLPFDQDVWLFGWDNKFRNIVEKEILKYGNSVKSDEVNINEKIIDRKKNSIILAVKNPKKKSRVIVLLSTNEEKALNGLGRKLPHYGKYSFLSFSGIEPNVNLKGQWQVKESPLKKVFSKSPKLSYKIPRRKALAYLPPQFSGENMKKVIKYLSGSKLEGRGVGTKGLDIAADYIAGKFKKYGLQPAGDNNSYFQQWAVKTGPNKDSIVLKNIIGLIQGRKNEFKDQIVIIGAHYDHLGYGWPDVREGNEGSIHPGADDNASGVAVILEIAKNMGKSFSPDRSILFIAFTTEENKLMGSEYFVKNYKKFPIKKTIAMVNLDTVGRLYDKKPMIIGSGSAKAWKFIFMGVGYTTGIETNLIVQDLDSSDQISFMRAGIPAIQIFSGPHLDYHKPTDTYDKIDPKGLVKIANITKEVVVYLSGREKPIAFTGNVDTQNNSSMPVKRGSRASIGIMPDFSFSNGGVKVAFAMKSPEGNDHALKKGDIITHIGGKLVLNLKEYSAELKKYSPGQKVEIIFQRDKQQKKVNIIMRTR